MSPVVTRTSSMVTRKARAVRTPPDGALVIAPRPVSWTVGPEDFAVAREENRVGVLQLLSIRLGQYARPGWFRDLERPTTVDVMSAFEDVLRAETEHAMHAVGDGTIGLDHALTQRFRAAPNRGIEEQHAQRAVRPDIVEQRIASDRARARPHRGSILHLEQVARLADER